MISNEKRITVNVLRNDNTALQVSKRLNRNDKMVKKKIQNGSNIRKLGFSVLQKSLDKI